MAVSRAFLADLSGGNSSSLGPTSIGQFLDLYVIHMIMTLVFIIGAIILIDKFAAHASKPVSNWDDLFYALGGITLIFNTGFLVALFFGWISRRSAALARNDIELHWLHAVSIIAAGFTVIWGVLALIVTFGTALTPAVSDQTEVGGYFMVFIGVAYSTYLVVRYCFGLAGTETTTKPSGIQAPAAYDINALLAATRASAPVASAQPIFGGGNGLAAFGGLDMSGLLPSSMTATTTSGTGNCMSSGTQQQAPIIMMMPQQQPMMYCSPQPVQDPNAVTL